MVRDIVDQVVRRKVTYLYALTRVASISLGYRVMLQTENANYREAASFWYSLGATLEVNDTCQIDVHCYSSFVYILCSLHGTPQRLPKPSVS